MKTIKEGTKVTCIKSESEFYTLGKEYTVSKYMGVLGTFADDGLFDHWGKTLSKFEAIGQKRIGVVK